AYASYEFALLLAHDNEQVALERNLGRKDHPDVLAFREARRPLSARWTAAHHLAWDWIEFTSWPAIIAFVAWIFLASRNLGVLQAGGALYSSPRILVLFFIPLVNAVIAYISLMELWKTSDHRATSDLESWRSVGASLMVRLAG